MNKVDNLPEKSDIKSILKRSDVLIFIGIFFIALTLLLLFDGDLKYYYLSFIFSSMGWAILLVVTPLLTKKIQPPTIETSYEIKESTVLYGWFILGIIIIILIISPLTITLGPLLWGIICAVFMTIIGFIIPLLFLMFIRKYSLKSLGLSRNNIKQNIFASVITFIGIIIVGLLIDTLIFGYDIIIFFIQIPFRLFYTLLIAALPEEFVYRAVIQTRVSNHFNSKIRGILITSILFSLTHIIGPFISSNFQLGLLPILILRTLVMQTIGGIVFGIMWSKTHNLMLPVITHMVWDIIG